MPELPEVETVRRGLERLVVGRRVKAIMVHDSPKSFPNNWDDVEQFAYGATIVAVRLERKCCSLSFLRITHLLLI